MTDQRPQVPWRTIFATVFVVGATLLAAWLVQHLARVLTWMVIAGFFAVVLGPAVEFLVREAKVRRGVAIMLVFAGTTAVLGAMMYAFIRPLVDQAQEFSDRFPQYVADAKEGKGTVGKLVRRYNIDEYIEKNQSKINDALQGFRKPALKALQGAANFLVGLITVLVLTFLILLEAPDMLRSGLGAIREDRRVHVATVARDSARAISGYMAGNVLISIIAGVASFVFLFFAKVPFRGVLALWVAFADLIPLVGATLGAIPAVLVAFLDSVPKGVATVIFFIVYQQFENHVLQVTIMSRTVSLNPLLVLVSVLVGVELFGILGALLAIPAGGVIQVVARDLWDVRRGQLKEVPTEGTDQVPVEPVPPEDADGDAGDEDAGEQLALTTGSTDALVEPPPREPEPAAREVGDGP